MLFLEKACVYFCLIVSVPPPLPQEHEREKHAHGVLQFQFTELKETLKQSEEMLTVSTTAADNHTYEDPTLSTRTNS